MTTLNALGLILLLAPLVAAYLFGRHDGPRTAGVLVAITVAVGAYFAIAGALLAQ